MTTTTDRPGRSHPPAARRRRRAPWLIALALAMIVGLAIAAAVSFRTVAPKLAATGCTVGAYDITTDQASVAAQMVGAVTSYRVALPRRATVLTLAAALQESKLTNIPPGDGDRDSVGVLQQRPSQGWGGGSAKKLTDVTEATTEFLDALVRVPNWQRLPLATAVQDVQISADGSAYAQHEPEATALAAALQGVRPAAITCSFAAPTIVAPARLVARRASAQLGIDTPAATADGVRVPGAGWQTAAWFVANADRLGVDRVAYDGRRWSRTGGWQSSTDPARAVVATMAMLG